MFRRFGPETALLHIDGQKGVNALEHWDRPTGRRNTGDQIEGLEGDIWVAKDVNRVGPEGIDHDPESVHQMTVANLHGEFCTPPTVDDVRRLLVADRPDLHRVQGNE